MLLNLSNAEGSDGEKTFLAKAKDKAFLLKILTYSYIGIYYLWTQNYANLDLLRPCVAFPFNGKNYICLFLDVSTI